MSTRSTTIAMAAGMLLLASTALAANFCVSFGGAQIIASGLTLPAKGTCTAFNGFYANKAGSLLAGDVCRSSNGSTFLFNTFTQFSGSPDSIAGTWNASTGKGSGKECFGPPCAAFNVTVTKCPANITVPADLSGFDTKDTESSVTTDAP